MSERTAREIVEPSNTDIFASPESVQIYIHCLQAEIARLTTDLKSITAATQETVTENAKLSEQVEELARVLKKVRGTLGYGPLDTLPSTIKAVRKILASAIYSSPESSKG